MAVVITQTANPAGENAASNIATYTGVSIGTASASRIVVVTVGTELASSTPSACTIDYGSGDTAMTAGSGGNFGAMYSQMYYLAVPTGTTATIKVTYSATNPTSVQNHIAVYSVTGGTFSSSGADSSTDMDTTRRLTTGSITIGAAGGFLGVAVGAADTVTKTWANATKDIDADAGDFRFTTASTTTAGTVTITCTGSTNGEDGALTYMIFKNDSPTVALNTPTDTQTISDTTPDLVFTGTDPDTDDITYNVQVDTVNTFDTGSALQFDGSQNYLSLGTLGTFGSNLSNGFYVKFDIVMSLTTTWEEGCVWAGSPGSCAIIVSLNTDSTGSNSPGKIRFYSRDQNSVELQGATTNSTGFNDGEKHTIEVTVVFSTNTVTIKVDGVAYAFTYAVQNTPSSFSNLNQNYPFGARNNNGSIDFYLAAKMDNILIGTSSSTLYGSYTLSEGTGTTTADGTGNGNTGNLIKGAGAYPSWVAGLAPPINAISSLDTGFSGSPDNTDPFATGQQVTYTVQSALSDGTYYWRVRGKDPSGKNVWGSWATTRSFILNSSGVAAKPANAYMTTNTFFWG